MSHAAGGKYCIIAHLRGGDVTEASLAMLEGDGARGDQLAVIKRLKLGADAEPPVLKRFAEEARVCKLLVHPNITRLIESGQDADGPLLVFDYLEGPTLARVRSRALRQGDGVPRPIALYVVKELTKALAYAHTAADENGKPLKLVHRDVSPDNVTVTYDGEVKLSEFGMATTATSSSKSRDERVRGNLAYMAPEQARADFGLDPRADLFAVGVILWELLTGKRLWEGLAEVDVLARLADDKALPTVRSVVPDVSENLDALCTQALAKVRDERFDTATDLLEALDKVSQAPELRASASDVGAFVASLFDDERTKMHALVAEARTNRHDSKSALPAIGAPPPAGDASPFVDAESNPRLRFGVAAPEEVPTRRVIEVIRVEPSSDRRFTILMAGVVLVVFGIVALVALTRDPAEDKKPEDKAYFAPRPKPVATGEPAVSAYVEPSEVTIDIQVTPPSATLFVDGVKAASNPYRTRVVPGSYRHSVRAEAPGFEPRTMTVLFDRDRAIEIALSPVPPPRPVRRPEPPPPSPKPSAASPAPSAAAPPEP